MMGLFDTWLGNGDGDPIIYDVCPKYFNYF